MVSSSSFFSEFHADKIEPETAPRFMVGAASPLWLMFGGAAAAGAAYWWWASRWREAVKSRPAVQRGIDLGKELRRSAPPTDAERAILFNQTAQALRS